MKEQSRRDMLRMSLVDVFKTLKYNDGRNHRSITKLKVPREKTFEKLTKVMLRMNLMMNLM